MVSPALYWCIVVDSSLRVELTVRPQLSVLSGLTGSACIRLTRPSRIMATSSWVMKFQEVSAVGFLPHLRVDRHPDEVSDHRGAQLGLFARPSPESVLPHQVHPQRGTGGDFLPTRNFG